MLSDCLAGDHSLSQHLIRAGLEKVTDGVNHIGNLVVVQLRVYGQRQDGLGVGLSDREVSL